MRNIINILVVHLLLSLFVNGADITLIDPKEAVRLIGNKKVVFISGDAPSEYNRQHILNSIRMYAYDLHYLDSECQPLSSCLAKAKEYIQGKGVTDDQLIIAYDNFYGYNAMGVYSFFMSLGYLNIKVLNGGTNTIKELDPNQKVFDKLEKEKKEIERELLFVTKSKDINKDKIERLRDDLISLQATIDIIIPKLLIQSQK